MGRDIVRGIAFAARGMRRNPGFAALVVATLALGIGANATMFSVVDRLLLQPPEHVVDADRVVRVFFQRVSPFSRRSEVSPAASYPDYLDLVGVEAFHAVAGYGTTTLTLGTGEEAVRVQAQLASGTIFDLLGVRPALGRFFGPEDDRIDAGEPVAVLAHGLWTRRFGADPGVLGREVDLGSGAYTVVGVAPPGFTGATLEPVDVWVPLTTGQALENGTAWEDARGWYWLAMVGRLADGVAIEPVQERATAAHRAGRAEQTAQGRYDPEASVVLGSVVPGRSLDAGGEVAVARWLAGVALMVLLIACANVANLLLVRGIRWRRELAVRRALGISERALRTMLLVEIGVLAALGAVAAVITAHWGGPLIFRTLLPDVGAVGSSVGPRLLGFTALAAVAATALAGLVPSLRATRGDLERDLRSGAATAPGRSRLRAGLTVAQVGMSVVLLVGAGLFLRSLLEVDRLDLGYEPRNLLVATVETEGGSFGEEASRTVQEAARRLRGAPGVAGTATASLTPFRGMWGIPFRPEGMDSLPLPRGPYHYVADAGYFQVMGMGLRRGRGFSEADMAEGAAPVAVLTEDLAARAFPGVEAVGRCIYVRPGQSADPPPCTTVVGVLADHRSSSLEEAESPIYYLPSSHPAVDRSDLRTLVVRMEPQAADVAPRVRRVLLEASPTARFAQVSAATDAIDRRARSWRLGATLFGIFGGLALVVAALGLYAILAFDVAQRRRDLAVRSALGAPAGRLSGAVLGRALLLTAVGLALGMAVAVALTGSLRALLFGVEGLEPGIVAVVVGTMLTVTVVSTLVPAHRAGRVAPAEVLRTE